ncbi:MAG TPA: hypothetical protein VNM69_08875 [Bacillus sp. (in: firmicutes)]|uniref:hypothetical protein n=1 Tax=Bacillus litorisediminis TaxID=2922713 RepID=UPI001FAF01C8|nr:hypothetical protein [Bacillus litorisediminis]HWO75994.1 hypothetical protein [Bacillus sp. (in: firmicutes)]
MKKLSSDRTEEEDKFNNGSSTRTPRWVKVFGIIGILFIILVIVMLVFGNGEHGPGRHFSSSDYKSGLEQSLPKIKDYTLTGGSY